jgi:hypothetical protein
VLREVASLAQGKEHRPDLALFIHEAVRIELMGGDEAVGLA